MRWNQKLWKYGMEIMKMLEFFPTYNESVHCYTFPFLLIYYIINLLIEPAFHLIPSFTKRKFYSKKESY